MNILLAQRVLETWTFNTLTPSDFKSAIERYLFELMNILLAKESLNINFLYMLTPFDVISAWQKSTFDLLNIFLAKDSLKINLLYIQIDFFWYYISQTSVKIWTTKHIFGQRVLITWISIRWLLLMLHQPYRSSYLTKGTYYWKNSPQSWTFYTHS
jgi:hypothetical protein